MIRRSRIVGEPLGLVSAGPRRIHEPGELWPRVAGGGAAVQAYSPQTQSMEFFKAGYVNFPHNAQLEISTSDERTLLIWWRARPQATNNRTMFSKFNGSTVKGYAVYFGATDRLAFAMWTSGSQYIYKVLSAAAGMDAAWHLAAITLDGTGTVGGIRIFHDATEPATTTGAVGSMGTTNNGVSLRVGAAVNWAGQEYDDGRLMHSALIDHALSPAEIAVVFSLGLAVDLTGIVAPSEILHHCTLGDGCSLGAGNCPDLSSLANHGTMNFMSADDIVLDVPPTPARSDALPLTRSLNLQSDAADEHVDYVKNVANTIEKDTKLSIGGWIKNTIPYGFTWHGIMGRTNYNQVDLVRSGYAVAFSAEQAQLVLHQRSEIIPGGARSTAVASRGLGSRALADGNWHFFCLTTDPDGSYRQYVKCGIDDSYWTTMTTSGTLLTNGTMVHPTKSFEVGRWDGGGAIQYYEGQVCHLFLYKGRTLDKFDMWRLQAYGPQVLTDMAHADDLAWWDTMGDGDTLGYERMVDLEAANNGTCFNLETANPRPESPGGIYSTKSMVFGGGAGQYVNLGNVLNFERTNAFSWSFWLNPASAASAEIVSNSAGAAGSYRGYEVYRVSDGRVGMALYSTYSTNYFSISTSGSVSPLGDWVHVVATYDGSSLSSGVTIYINGVSQAMGAPGAETLSATIVHAGDLNFARRATDDTVRLNGFLDDVAVYDRELTGPEVTAIYGAGVPNDLSLLSSWTDNVGRWKMGDGDTLPTLLDSGNGTSNDGTFVGAGEDFVEDAPLGPAYTPMPLSTRFNAGGAGDDEQIVFGNISDADIPAATPRTVGCWLKFPSDSVNRHFLNKWHSGNNIGWRFWISTADTLAFQVRSGPSDWIQRHTDSAIAVNTWLLVIATIDGSGTVGGMKLYVNGVQPATSTSVGGTVASAENGSDFYLSGYDVGGSIVNDYIGFACHSFIIAEELTPSECAQLASQGVPLHLIEALPTRTLKHWCTHGDGCDTTGPNLYPDLSGLGNHGTAQNVDVGDLQGDVPP